MLEHLLNGVELKDAKENPQSFSLWINSLPKRSDETPFSFPQDGLGWHFVVQGRGQVAHHESPKYSPSYFSMITRSSKPSASNTKRGREHFGRSARGHSEPQPAAIRDQEKLEEYLTSIRGVSKKLSSRNGSAPNKEAWG